MRNPQRVAEALAYPEAQPPWETPRSQRRGRKKRRPGHDLALRLRNHWESVLRFLDEPAGPFTYNQAEQDMRMMQVRQKISDGRRPEKVAQDFATWRSVLSSGRQQGRNRLEALLQRPEVPLAALPA